LKDHELYFKRFILSGLETKKFDLSCYFKYVLHPCEDKTTYILTPKHGVTLEMMSVANCIVFGESNIRYEDVEKLLSLVRFDRQTYSYIIDNFKITYYSNQYLSINGDNKKINSMNFCKYQDITECAKWLIQIMNHFEKKYLNLHNYFILKQYCWEKDLSPEKIFNNLIDKEMYRIKKTNFDNPNKDKELEMNYSNSKNNSKNNIYNSFMNIFK